MLPSRTLLALSALYNATAARNPRLIFVVTMTSRRAYESCEECALPIGSLVVPFWDYLIGFYDYI